MGTDSFFGNSFPAKNGLLPRNERSVARSVTFLTMRLMDGEIDLVARFVVATSRASERASEEEEEEEENKR